MAFLRGFGLLFALASALTGTLASITSCKNICTLPHSRHKRTARRLPPNIPPLTLSASGAYHTPPFEVSLPHSKFVEPQIAHACSAGFVFDFMILYPIADSGWSTMTIPQHARPPKFTLARKVP